LPIFNCPLPICILLLGLWLLVFALVSLESFAAGLEQIGNWQSEIGNVVAAQPHMQNQIHYAKK